MTRTKGLLLALALAGPGCLSPLTHLDDDAHKSATPPVKAAAPEAPPVVMAEEVTEVNAVEKARALARELDFAANERVGEPTTAAQASATTP